MFSPRRSALAVKTLYFFPDPIFRLFRHRILFLILQQQVVEIIVFRQKNPPYKLLMLIGGIKIWFGFIDYEYFYFSGSSLFK